MHLFIRIVTVTICSCLTIHSISCTKSPTENEKIYANSFKAPKGKALLYIYRPSSLRAALPLMPINIDGEHIASTANGTFVAIPLELKKYSIQAGGPIGAPAAQYKKEFPARVITPKSGDLYFIRQEIKMIPYSRTAPQFMMLQTGGSPIPIAMGGGSIAGCYTFHADNKTGKLECSKLRQVRADFSE